MPDALRLAKGQTTDLRTRIKIWLGQIYSGIDSKRTIANFKRPSHHSGLIDRLVLSYLRDRCAAENRARFFERLHTSFWSGSGGVDFAENCSHRFEDLFLAHQIPDFRKLENFLDVYSSIHRVVEIGTSSGRFLEYLVANLTQIETAIGLDLNEAQIAENLRKPKSPKIEYFATDATKWISDNVAPSTLYVSNGGVLEYFSRSSLDQLLQALGPDVAFYSSEPVAIDHEANNVKSMPFGDELSFSHNYRHVFESNGFTVHYQRPTDYVAACQTQYRMLVTIASN